MEKSGCRPGHEKHLCHLFAKKAPLVEVKKLVKGARFICRGCMRVAASKESLCDPDEISASAAP